MSRLRRLPWIFELRDLWPASIVAVGAMKEGLLIRMLYWIEMSMYRASDRVIAVTKGLRQDLVDARYMLISIQYSMRMSRPSFMAPTATMEEAHTCNPSYSGG